MFLWDSLFPLLSLKGAGSRKFLQGQLTSEILSLEENKIIQTCWLSPVGRIKALLEVRVFNDEAQILILSGKVEDVMNGLEKVIFPSDQVNLKLNGKIRRVQKISFQESWEENVCEWVQSDSKLLEQCNNLNVASSGKFEEWRINQGFPSNVRELNGETNPFELGLGNLITLSKGCFLGQETLAKLKNIGYVKQELRFFECSKYFYPGDKLFIHKEGDSKNLDSAGLITSSLEISKNKTIGLALIRKKYLGINQLILNDSNLPISLNVPIGFKKLPL